MMQEPINLFPPEGTHTPWMYKSGIRVWSSTEAQFNQPRLLGTIRLCNESLAPASEKNPLSSAPERERKLQSPEHTVVFGWRTSAFDGLPGTSRRRHLPCVSTRPCSAHASARLVPGMYLGLSLTSCSIRPGIFTL